MGVRPSSKASDDGFGNTTKTKKRCLLTTGLESAFYHVHQYCVFLQGIGRVAPGLAEKILSKRGVQQAEPSAHSFSPLALEGAISKDEYRMKASTALLDMTVFFLENGTAGVSHEATQVFLTLACKEGLDVRGLTLKV